MGGSAAIQAAKYIPSARALVTIASPSETTHLRSKFPQQFRRIDETGSAELTIGGVTFRLRREFVADLESHRMDQAIAALGRPFLIINSAADATIDLSHGEKMYRAAQAPKGIVTLDLADHLLSSPRDSEHVAAIIAAWAGRYLFAER
jgi:putative redox protein